MLPLISVDEAKRRGEGAGLRPELASVNAFRCLLNNPKVGGAAGHFLTTLLLEGSLDTRIRELVILRTGWRSGSEYEFCQHVAIARRLKLSEEEILGVRDPESCKSFSELDRTVIKLTDELLQGTEISSATWEKLARAFDVPQLLELLAVAANWRFFAVFLKAGEVPLDNGVPSWPEGRAPQTRI